MAKTSKKTSKGQITIVFRHTKTSKKTSKGQTIMVVRHAKTGQFAAVDPKKVTKKGMYIHTRIAKAGFTDPSSSAVIKKTAKKYHGTLERLAKR